MAHSSFVVVEAIADQLLAELDVYERLLLDVYERLLLELAQRDGDAGIVHSLAEQADRIYVCAQSLPRVAVSFTEFLITRTELSHALCAPTRPAELGHAHGDHLAALLALRRATQRVKASAASGLQGASGEGAASALRALERMRQPRH